MRKRLTIDGKVLHRERTSDLLNRKGDLPWSEDYDPQIDLLAQRARAKDATVELLDERRLAEIEPDLRTATGRALHSPDKPVVDAKTLVRFLVNLLRYNVVVTPFVTIAADPMT